MASPAANNKAFPVLPDAKPSNTSPLQDEERALLTKHTLQARDRAYCPYSSFRVGATLLTTDGVLIPGANYENAAYPSGTCAERVALGVAVAALGCGPGSFRALGVATDLRAPEGTDGDGGESGFCSPCGMCRQALREFCSLDMPIYMHDCTGRFIVRTMGELLPMSFGPEALRLNDKQHSS